MDAQIGNKLNEKTYTRHSHRVYKKFETNLNHLSVVKADDFEYFVEFLKGKFLKERSGDMPAIIKIVRTVKGKHHFAVLGPKSVKQGTPVFKHDYLSRNGNMREFTTLGYAIRAVIKHHPEASKVVIVLPSSVDEETDCAARSLKASFGTAVATLKDNKHRLYHGAIDARGY